MPILCSVDRARSALLARGTLVSEAIALPAWWKQCETNASKVGLVPLLVFKRNREEPLAVLRWTDLLALLRHDHRWQNLAEGLTGGRA
jgi:hypothetical protein